MVTQPTAAVEHVRVKRPNWVFGHTEPRVDDTEFEDPRDEFVRSSEPVSITALAEKWHKPGVRDGCSCAALARRCEAEGWVAERERLHDVEATDVASRLSARELWARHVTARLADILDALANEAADGKLPAIQVVLKYEGLLDSDSSAGAADDHYPVIVGLCCDPVR